MESSEMKTSKRKGGLEFVPLPEGKTEDFYRLPCGRRHPGQLDVFVQAEEVRSNGKKRG